MSEKEQAARNLQASPAFGSALGSPNKRRRTKNRHAAKIPNETTLEAIEQSRTGKGLVGPFDSFEELWTDLNTDD